MGSRPSLGFGVGLRPKHYAHVLRERPDVDWLEIVTENYLGVGGRPRRWLSSVRERYPVVMHGVGLSIAGTDELSPVYLKKLRELALWLEPRFVSDHLCWTSHGGINSHDLLPLAYNAETLRHVAARVARVQDVLGRQILLENPSTYVTFAANDRDEADFLAELCRRTGCGLLLDVNNLYVNAANLGMDAPRYLATLDPATVGYFHLAGHSVLPEIRIDTHDEPVPEGVWRLYQDAVRRFPAAATLVEWDGNLPEFPVLLAELDRAREVHATVLSEPPLVTPAPGRQPFRIEAAGETPWRDLQDQFFSLVTRGDSVGPDDAGLALFADGGPARPLVGVNVYADAYWLRIADVIRETFPALTTVLGASVFNGLIRDYLAVHPPHHLSVKYAAAALPEWLRTCRLPEGVGVPARVLADVAALEWAREDLFDHEDDPTPLALSVLQEIAPDDWARVRFDFVGALRVVATEYQVAPVLAAVHDGEAPERPAAGHRWYVVYRADEEVLHDEIEAEDAVLLEALRRGATFLGACEDARPHGEDDTAWITHAAGLLAQWIGMGLVHAVRLDEEGARLATGPENRSPIS